MLKWSTKAIEWSITWQPGIVVSMLASIYTRHSYYFHGMDDCL